MDSYKTFISELEESYEQLWAVAEDKLWWEGFTIAGKGLVFAAKDYFNDAGDEEAAKKEETWKKIESFAKAGCFDCSEIEDSLEKLKDPEESFTILEESRAVDKGLRSWNEDVSHSAEMFKNYYVIDNISRRDGQLNLLRWSHAYLDAVREVVKMNRKQLKNAIASTQKSLEEYDPVEIWMFGTIEGLIATVGCAFGPVTAGVMLAADFVTTEFIKPAFEGNDLNVVEMFAGLRTAVGTMHDNTDDAFEKLQSKIESTCQDIEDYSGSYVCSRPSQTVLDEYTDVSELR